MTQYKLGRTTFYLEDLRAVKRGDSGACLVYLYLYLRDLPQPVTVHIDQTDEQPFRDAWDAARNPEVGSEGAPSA